MPKQKPSSKKLARRSRFYLMLSKEKNMTRFAPWAEEQDSQPAAKAKEADSKMSFPICSAEAEEDSPEASVADSTSVRQQGWT